MAKKVFGLASLKLADVAGDGGMGTNLKTVGETVSGTAVMSQDDNTTTEFTIEESSSPIESIVSAEGKVRLAWSSYRVDYVTMKKLFGGTGNYYQVAGTILTMGAITPGTVYTNGYYENVALTGGAGTGARANITVSGGGVSAVEIINGGSGYAAANNLSALAADIGGTGSGFQQPVVSVASTTLAEKWEAPDSFPDTEQSVQLTDAKGNVLKIPRAKIAAKVGLSFAKDKLGQIDMVATILQPTKANEKRFTLILAQ